MSLENSNLFSVVDDYGFSETNDRYSKLNCEVNLLSFQSLEVLKILTKSVAYRPDLSMSRERRDYSADINQLGGYSPVWCFSPFTKSLEYSTEFRKSLFMNGSLFERFKCEMSLSSSMEFNKLFLFELRVPSNLIKVGLTHNAYEGAVVIPEIRRDYVVAIYKLSYQDSDPTKWFYPDVKIIKRFKKNSLFDYDFSCDPNKVPKLLNRYR